MELIVDCREAALIPHLPGAVVKQLPLADIAITRDGVDLVLLERKTVADLAASIKDGRYREQSSRLLECTVPNHNIMYLIEGSMRGDRLPLPRRTLLAALVSLNFGKGFSVVRTESVEQTIEFVQVLFEKLGKENAYESASAASVLPKKEKKDNITPQNIDVLMLSQIPYVSAQTAEAVLAEHKTIHGLVDALKANPDCLNAVVFATSKRKISSKSVQSIRDFLQC